MRDRLIRGLLLGCLLAGGAVGMEAQESPSAESLLQSVRDAIPRTPLKLLAEVQSRDAEGDLRKVLRLEARLDARADGYRASYRIYDAFGALREEFGIAHAEGAGTTYSYGKGEELEPAPSPDLSDAVEGTDISWAELSLAFLWWEGGVTVGEATVSGRNCLVVELPAPAGARGAYRSVRLWIEPVIHVILRAEGAGGDGKPVRELEVRSFKKIDDLWLIKNIEVRDSATRSKTVVRVRAVEREGGS